jgi:hypothetical protein
MTRRQKGRTLMDDDGVRLLTPEDFQADKQRALELIEMMLLNLDALGGDDDFKSYMFKELGAYNENTGLGKKYLNFIGTQRDHRRELFLCLSELAGLLGPEFKSVVDHYIGMPDSEQD